MGKCVLRSALMAALLLTFLTTLAWADTLKLGSKGEMVSALQINLIDKGYYNGKVSGKYESALVKAVGVFQIANDINIPKNKLGVADEQTQKLAASKDAVTFPQYEEKLSDNQLKPGGSGTYVKKAQTRLKALGFYTGKIDSRYRATTTKAVQDFQTANGLSSTGIANSATREVLYNSDSVITRAMYDAMNFITPLGAGSKGEQVRQLQQRLFDLGYYWGDINGNYDAQTKYSVKFFQEANGFSANGSASRPVREKANNTDSAVKWTDYTKNMTMIQLTAGCKSGVRVALLQLQLKNLGYYKGVITGVFTGTTTTAVRTFQIFNDLDSKYVTGKANTTTRTKLLDAKAIRYEAVYGSDTLRIGSTDTEAIKDLQTRLNKLGYYNGDVDGVYDSGVASAVKLFQRYNDGLYPTGIAYTNTLAAIKDPSAKSYTNAHIEKFIEIAKDHLGDKYVRGKQGPSQFDCSGFTSYCLKQVGINVTSGVYYQARTKFGKKITITDNKNYKELKRGDVLFFYTPRDDTGKPDTRPGHVPGHAAIYLGNNQFIHASSGVGKVTISSFKTYNERNYGPWFLWAIRVWE